MLLKKFNDIDLAIVRFMAQYGIRFLRLSIGLIFLWFGTLKFFDGLSPAEDIALITTRTLTMGLLPDTLLLAGLATLEVVIGIGLIFNLYLRLVLLLLFFQMAGTFAPVFLFPDLVFVRFPYALTIEGQYIFKNLVVISGGLVIGATVREKKRGDKMKKGV